MGFRGFRALPLHHASLGGKRDDSSNPEFHQRDNHVVETVLSDERGRDGDLRARRRLGNLRRRGTHRQGIASVLENFVAAPRALAVRDRNDFANPQPSHSGEMVAVAAIDRELAGQMGCERVGRRARKGSRMRDRGHAPNFIGMPNESLRKALRGVHALLHRGAARNG